MHMLLVTLGSSGDVHPFVGLGLKLRGRGHRVTLITSGYFEELVRRAGLDFVAMGTKDEFIKLSNRRDLWHPRRAIHVILENILPLMKRIYEEVERHYVPGETVIAASSLCMGARCFQEKTGATLATIHLAPAIMRSLHDTPVLGNVGVGAGSPRWMKRAMYWIADNCVIDRYAAPPFNAMRKEWGLPPVKGIMRDYWHSPQRVIGMWPDWFAPVQPDWPGQVRLSGFPLYDESGVSAVPEELERFLNEGEKPIAFTPGSAYMFGASFFQQSVQACQKLGRRGLLLSRHREHIPKNLPAGVRHFDFAPFGQLLPRCAAVVHHGGIGSVAQALATGTPQVVMPMAHDQYDNAHRVEKLRAGRTLKASRYRSDRAARMLGELTGLPEIASACKAVAARFVGVDALKQTCEILEQLGSTVPEKPAGFRHAARI